MSFNFVVTRRQTILTVVLLHSTLTTHGADMNRLSDYQWENRLILVQAANENGGEIETLNSARAAVDDRDIVWFVYTGPGVVSNQKALSSSLESSLELDAIFRRIDAMPMRSREMRAN